jgi:hypothetical protein
MTLLALECRIQTPATALIAMAMPAAVPLLLNLGQAPLKYAELLWPLAAPLLMAGLFSREWETGTAEVLLARPRPRAALLAGRLAVALAQLALAFLAGWAACLARGYAAPLADLLAAAGPGALALGTAGLAAATATRSSPVGYLAPTAWWLLDWLTQGHFTGRLYLLGGLTGDKWWLLGLAATLLMIATLVMNRRDK